MRQLDYSDHYVQIDDCRVSKDFLKQYTLEELVYLVRILRRENLGEETVKMGSVSIRYITRVKDTAENCSKCNKPLSVVVKEVVNPEENDSIQYLPERSHFTAFLKCEDCDADEPFREFWDVLSLGVQKPPMPMLIAKIGASTWKAVFPSYNPNN